MAPSFFQFILIFCSVSSFRNFLTAVSYWIAFPKTRWFQLGVLVVQQSPTSVLSYHNHSSMKQTRYLAWISSLLKIYSDMPYRPNHSFQRCPANHRRSCLSSWHTSYGFSRVAKDCIFQGGQPVCSKDNLLKIIFLETCRRVCLEPSRPVCWCLEYHQSLTIFWYNG